MKIILSFFTILFSLGAWANLHLAPPDYNTDHGRAIFVDFKTAKYDITYDVVKRKTIVRSKITFVAKSKGHAVFDLLSEPTDLILNGKPTSQRLTTFPGGVSSLRMLTTSVGPGTHVLEMTNTFKKNVRYNVLTSTVSTAFWIRDLKERKFLEQYVPSNFEFDQYQIIMDVKVKGWKKAKQDVFTNGKLTQLGDNHWRIVFPEHYTVACPYFHMTPKGITRQINFSYSSIDGREIPITVYSYFPSQARSFQKETIRVMKELEADYGPWGHDAFVAYGTLPGTGGMEHAGATQTSFGALDHEMLHSYFAKGVMPANGNSGWIDEAIASWRDRGYPRLPDPGFDGSDIGGQSIYKRHTDSRSYALGSAFMAYLDWRLQDLGGLKAFLKGYFKAYNRTVVTTEHFKNNLEFFAGLDLSQEFNRYIWGKTTHESADLEVENPHHPALTEEQLASLL
jgi:hypothetical protein